jgi:hypothetical protein
MIRSPVIVNWLAEPMRVILLIVDPTVIVPVYRGQKAAEAGITTSVRVEGTV